MLFLQYHLHTPPIKSWDLCVLPLNPDGLVSTLEVMLYDSET